MSQEEQGAPQQPDNTDREYDDFLHPAREESEQDAFAESTSAAPRFKHARTNQTTSDGTFDPEVIRVKKKIRKKRKKMPRALFISLVSLAAVVVLAVGGFAVNYSLGQSNLKAAPTDDTLVSENAVNTNQGKTITYDGHTYEYNENMVSIAFLGFDRDSVSEYDENQKGQADTIMVMGIDTVTGEVKIIAIPRDTMEDVDTYNTEGSFLNTRNMQICLAFSYGDGQHTSCENTVTSVKRVMHSMPVNYYFALDQNGIDILNDTIGGVVVTALETIPGTSIVEGEDVLLMGNNAYKYVQYRNVDELDSALSRQERQIQYVQAFASKALGLVNGNVGTLLDLIGAVQDNSLTNLGVSELTYLATSVAVNGVESVDIVTMPGEVTQGAYYAEYYLDETASYEVILDMYYTRKD